MDDANIDLSMPPMATAVPLPASAIPLSSSFSTKSSITADALPKIVGACNDNPVLRNEQTDQLQEQGFPAGLAAELGRTRAAYPVRFWVADNSGTSLCYCDAMILAGCFCCFVFLLNKRFIPIHPHPNAKGSMRTSDGHELRTMSTSTIEVVPCTRWTELQGSLSYHIQLAGLLEATTIFRLLNDPGVNIGPQEFCVGDPTARWNIATQVQHAVKVIEKSSPRGVTPLTQHLEEIRYHISTVEATLRQNGQDAVVVLATDGLPSNQYGESSDAVLKEFVIALKALQSLPVWIVVRLCTDDAKVVSYYNSLDQEVSGGRVELYVPLTY